MLFSEARRSDVVSTDTATRVARIDGFVVAADPARVVLLRLGKVKAEGSLLYWDDLQGFGPDAATIADVSVIRTPADELERQADSRELEILGKRVLSDRGDALGDITDVDFDMATGMVTTLLTRREAITGDRLIGHGRYAVVVSA